MARRTSEVLAGTLDKTWARPTQGRAGSSGTNPGLIGGAGQREPISFSGEQLQGRIHARSRQALPAAGATLNGHDNFLYCLPEAVQLPATGGVRGGVKVRLQVFKSQ
jgi:hypothetical protein